MSHEISRRTLFSAAAVAGAAQFSQTHIAQAQGVRPDSEPFGYCLNTGTIRGQELTITEEIDIAAEAGYDAIEPWCRKIDQFVEGGGKLSDLRKRLDDHGISVQSAIAFSQWIVDDDAKRAEGLEDAKRNMDTIAQIGGDLIAAPPAGATGQDDLDLYKAAERYRALLELGDEMAVTPQVEVWGPSKTLSRLGEAVFVAIESGHPRACLLPDIYHLFRGGNDFSGLKILEGMAMHVFHANDYPASPPRQEMNDSHRVYPGDGVAPLNQIYRTLYDNGFRGMLSLELFNQTYWEQPALEVAKTGLQKLRQSVRAALA